MDKVQEIFESLRELPHTDFVYLLGDLCAIRGWDPELKIGDATSPGDLIVRQTLPTPRSISIVYADGAELTGERVEDYVTTLDADELTVVVSGRPSETVLEVASKREISIIGVGDIANEIVQLRATDVLQSYLPDDHELANDSEDIFASRQNTQSQPPSGLETNEDSQESSTPDQSESANRSNRTPDPPETDLGESFVQDEILGLKVTGASYVETSADFESGYLLSLDVASKALAIKYWGKYLSVIDTEGFSHDAKTQSEELKELSQVGGLHSPWKLHGGSSWSVGIPRGGKIKTAAMIPCASDTEIVELVYEYGGWAFEEDDDVIKEAGFDPNGDYKIRTELRDWQSLVNAGLTEELEAAVESAGFRIVDTA